VRVATADSRALLSQGALPPFVLVICVSVFIYYVSRRELLYFTQAWERFLTFRLSCSGWVVVYWFIWLFTYDFPSLVCIVQHFLFISIATSHPQLKSCHNSSHQDNSIRLACLAPDMPDATKLPYLVWRHNDAPDAIKFSCPRNWFWCQKILWQHSYS